MPNIDNQLLQAATIFLLTLIALILVFIAFGKVERQLKDDKKRLAR